MIDFDGLMLDPIYNSLGIAATFESRDGGQASLTVLDKTSGIEIEQGPLLRQTLRPAACVRVSELDDNEIDRTRLVDGQLTFSGNTWIVKSTRPKPKSGGKGEIYLFLQDAPA